jgi:hypothetical protein
MEVLLPYNIKGKITYNSIPIKGVKIELLDNITYSNTNGDFTLKGEYQTLTPLFISMEMFQDISLIPFDSNDNIKSDIGIIEMIPLKTSLEQDIIDNQQLFLF